MEQSVVASLPVGWVAFGALLLLGLGMASGWLWARRRYRRQAERSLRREQTRISELLNALPQAAVLVGEENHLMAWNPRAAQLLKDLNLPAGSIPLAVDAATERVARSGLTETLEIAAGSLPSHRWQVSVVPLQTEEILVLFQDQRAGSNQAQVYQQLISTLAHELRTPLTAIMGHVEILGTTRPEEEALWRRSLGFVAGETERLARLVEDILSLSRIDRIPINMQPVNLRVVVEEALSDLFETAEQNHVVPVIQTPTDLPRVLADADRMRQVFINLLDNAIKYAPNSTLTVRLTPEAEMVRVEVSDTGPGIPSADLPYIFEPFHRGQGVTAMVQGTGLGLTLVRAILEQHHAPVSVRSEPGLGTCFSFSLPIARSASRP